ncbi:hypothetical protein CIHG_08431 [Coccidioides immitis H538.4]|uniref:Uncharacterized protein n=3 Tax=Coccidioides immitis TaxID=5501 RepID=A0A0J8QQF0_COCIT|nr:hypothetical protein CIRG_02702 [Coccidioides immitis RMSCC 2394]KMU73553.1 hypothetical protein CISG_10095 [Coccidioides immitis RMSCC 3703]KMU90620.1 hypothetical protein CIHG_08431 [Coccidioides immitis H538.4]
MEAPVPLRILHGSDLYAGGAWLITARTMFLRIPRSPPAHNLSPNGHIFRAFFFRCPFRASQDNYNPINSSHREPVPNVSKDTFRLGGGRNILHIPVLHNPWKHSSNTLKRTKLSANGEDGDRALKKVGWGFSGSFHKLLCSADDIEYMIIQCKCWSYGRLRMEASYMFMTYGALSSADPHSSLADELPPEF